MSGATLTSCLGHRKQPAFPLPCLLLCRAQVQHPDLTPSPGHALGTGAGRARGPAEACSSLAVPLDCPLPPKTPPPLVLACWHRTPSAGSSRCRSVLPGRAHAQLHRLPARLWRRGRHHPRRRGEKPEAPAGKPSTGSRDVAPGTSSEPELPAPTRALTRAPPCSPAPLAENSTSAA